MGYVEKILGYDPVQSTDKPYNGWSTYETWLFNVHDDGNMFDDYTQQAWTDIQKASDEYETAEQAVRELLNRVADYAKEQVNDLFNIDRERDLLKRDFLISVIDRVNWHEIAMHYIDDMADQNFPLWKRVPVTHIVHSGIPGRVPNDSQWFENEELAIEYYESLKKIDIEEQGKESSTPDDPRMINNSIVTEIHPQRYEVTWGDKGAGYAVWIEDAEPGMHMDDMY